MSDSISEIPQWRCSVPWALKISFVIETCIWWNLREWKKQWGRLSGEIAMYLEMKMQFRRPMKRRFELQWKATVAHTTQNHKPSLPCKRKKHRRSRVRELTQKCLGRVGIADQESSEWKVWFILKSSAEKIKMQSVIYFEIIRRKNQNAQLALLLPRSHHQKDKSNSPQNHSTTSQDKTIPDEKGCTRMKMLPDPIADFFFLICWWSPILWLLQFWRNHTSLGLDPSIGCCSCCTHRSEYTNTLFFSGKKTSTFFTFSDQVKGKHPSLIRVSGDQKRICLLFTKSMVLLSRTTCLN